VAPSGRSYSTPPASPILRHPSLTVTRWSSQASPVKRFSEALSKLGAGALEGIAATESANSAVSGANLIPLLTLGIPDNLVAALLVVAFMIHGVTPGPSIFECDAQLIYGLFAEMIIANFLALVIGSIGLRVFALIVKVPTYVVYLIVLLLHGLRIVDMNRLAADNMMTHMLADIGAEVAG
jgi:TctA family transporter